MKRAALAILCGSIVLTGCATIINEDMVKIPVVTTPDGATIVVNGTNYTSPTTVAVPRGKGDFSLHIEKPGYAPVELMLTQSLDGWLWGNVLFGGIIGLAVDFATGKAYDVEPELISDELEGMEVSETSNGGLEIVLVDITQLSQDAQRKVFLSAQP